MVIEHIPEQVAKLRTSFELGRTRDASWRRGQLLALKRLLHEAEPQICDAVAADMGRPPTEAWVMEIGVVLAEIEVALDNLAAWMRDTKVNSILANFPSSSHVQRTPLGVVLIIAPWNYPIQLLLLPAVSAIAAGNCLLLKPSELAPRTSALMAQLVPRYLDPQCVALVEGGVEETTALLDQRFDHIFFTGGEHVGRIVMRAAAQHLTPVTLELGGKSPCYVAADADLDTAARRICWGKFVNAGQTCVAPDYVLVDRAVQGALLERLARTIRDFYGDDPSRSPDFGRVVNARHHQRIVGLIEGGGKVVVGGEHDEATRYVAPTVLRDVPPDADLMREEIFGPVLPVLTVTGATEAIAFINARPRPLALYVFTESEATWRRVLDATVSGGAAVNDVVSHAGVPDLPFGGVGASGMGAYHGRWGFENLSHARGVLVRSTTLDVKLRYPPYKKNLKWMKRVI